MTRRLRLDYPGALWHITSRGVDGQAIYRSDHDRQWFTRLLESAVTRYEWSLHAYVLMGNHFHLLVSSENATISRGMQYLNSEWASVFNLWTGRVGHLFERRFRGHLVEQERYLLNIARYIVLNPVRAGIARCPEEWKWSSYRETAGLTTECSWLQRETVLYSFHPTDVEEAQRHYADFVKEPRELDLVAPWANAIDRVFVGSESFARDARRRARLFKAQ
jgi:putative transposase